MIDLETHRKLMKKWPGRIYATPERVGPRLRHLEGLLPMLFEFDVLELGANAGLHAIEIKKYADSYLGVEPDADYRKQWYMTTEPHNGGRNMSLVASLKDVPIPWVVDEAGALVACVVLYLLSPTEIALMETRILPECELVIIQERVAHRERKGNTTNGLHTPKAIIKWLTAQGFTCCEYWDRKHKFFEIVGQK